MTFSSHRNDPDLLFFIFLFIYLFFVRVKAVYTLANLPGKYYNIIISYELHHFQLIVINGIIPKIM